MKNTPRSVIATLALVFVSVSLAPLEVRAKEREPARRVQTSRRRAAAARARPPRGKVTQEEFMAFPRAGRVRVRAVEARGRLPHLEFSRAETGRSLSRITLGTSGPESYRPLDEPGVSLIDPFVRFKPLNVEGLSAPLVLAVAIRPGGSDHTFETTLVGASGQSFRVLTPEPLLTSIQGGVFVGDLGGRYGVGIAVWNFLWEDSEAHYAAHRYEVKLYTFDARRSLFRRAAVLRSKGKHKRGEDALAELNLPRYSNLLDNFPAIESYRN